MNKEYYNGEHYSDPTAYNALRETRADKIKALKQRLRQIADKEGYEIVRLELKRKRTG